MTQTDIPPRSAFDEWLAEYDVPERANCPNPSCPSPTNNGHGYKALSIHWSLTKDCSAPELPLTVKEMLIGLLMGDGSISGNTGKNKHFNMANTNIPFVGWVIDSLNWLVSNVYIMDAKESEIEGKKFHSNPLATFHTHSHPFLTGLNEWYSNGKKTFPDSLTLQPLMVNMWYSCDGSLGGREVHIWGTNDSMTEEFAVDAFSEAPFDVDSKDEHYYVPSRDADEFFNWIGPPPPGMEYKWIGDVEPMKQITWSEQ